MENTKESKKDKKPVAKRRQSRDTRGKLGKARLFENPRIGLDYRAAAAALCVAVSTLQKLVSRGRIPHVKIGSLVRFIPEDLEAWLKENRRPR